MDARQVPVEAWPGVTPLRDIAGTTGEFAISHGILNTEGIAEVNAVLPRDQLMLCVHLSGTLWMQADSDLNHFEREGGENSAIIGIGGENYAIAYHARRCEFARLFLARSHFERALEDVGKAQALEFINPANRVDINLAALARQAVRLSGGIATDRLLADSIGYSIAAQLLKSWTNIGRPASAPSNAVMRPHDKRLKRVCDYIEDHLTSNLTLAELADQAGLSVPHFMRVFKASFGMSPYRWIIERKIARAKLLVAGSGCSMTEIALRLNFSSLQHFSAMFRKVTGIPPSRFQKSVRDGVDDQIL